MPESPVIAHVTLTVSDLNRSVPWYERVFDTKVVLDEEPGPFRRAVWRVALLNVLRDGPPWPAVA